MGKKQGGQSVINRVANIVVNDFINDSRVLKTSLTIMSLGLDVLVVALHNDGLAEHDVVNGVKVHRINLMSRSWPKLKLIQIIKYIEFVWRAVRICRGCSVIHCNDLNGLLPGVLIKWLNKGVKIVYDSHEFAINDVPNESWWSIRVKYILERFFIRFADEVIVVSQSIAEEYARLYSIKKPHIVLNCPPYVEQPKMDLFRQTFGIRPDQAIFLYQGALSKGRGIELLLQAFEQRQDDRCVLVCMGYGPLEAMVQELAHRSSLIFYHHAVQHNVLLTYTSSADFGISLIEDSCVSYRYCLPNKLFEYLMAGLPVIVSDLPEMRRLVLAESVGLVVKGGTLNEFDSAVEQLLAMDKTQTVLNVQRVRKKYCWESQERMLKTAYTH